MKMIKRLFFWGFILLPVLGFSQELDSKINSKTEGFFGAIYVDYHNYFHLEEITDWIVLPSESNSKKAFGTNLNFVGGYFLIPNRLSLAGGIGLYRAVSPRVDIFGAPLINGDLRFYFTDRPNTLYSFVNAGTTLGASFNNRGYLYHAGVGYKFFLTKKTLVSMDLSLVIPNYSKTKESYRDSNFKVNLQGIGFSLGFYVF